MAVANCCARWPRTTVPRRFSGVVAEGLADRFEPALCDVYAELFAEAIAPGESAAVGGTLPAGARSARGRRRRRVASSCFRASRWAPMSRLPA